MDDDKLIKANLVVMSISWLLWIPVSNAINIYWQVYLSTLGAPSYAIALIASIGTIIVALSRLIGGYFADKAGRKKIISILTYLVGFSYMLLGLATDWIQILIISIIMNILLLYQPALNAILADSMPKKQRARGYAITTMIPNITAILGPIIAFYVTTRYGIIAGLRLLLFVMWLVATIVATIRFFFLRETVSKQKLTLGFINDYRIITGGILSYMREVLVFGALANFALGLTVMIQLYSFQYIHISYGTWALLMEIYTIILIVFAYPVGHMADKFGKKVMLRYSSAFLSIALVFAYLTTLIEPILALSIYFILNAIGMSMLNTSLPAIQADYVDKYSRGKTFAVIALVNSMSLAIGQLISGIFYQVNPVITFLMASLLWILALFEAQNIPHEPKIKIDMMHIIFLKYPAFAETAKKYAKAYVGSIQKTQ